jgi:HD superfamily phosphohydrolase
MSREKIFKDPVYGYVSIKSEFITTFIDTPCFQRLRHIIQTSYSPVYAAALHNRFSHSLGVYHLGKIVYNNIKSFIKNNEDRFNSDGKSIEWINKHEDIFLAACLLHDIGHAPFSHTGEKFYETIENFYDIVYETISSCGNCNFKEVANNHGENANPHECMSVLIALETFNKYFDTIEPEDREFFSRCILGYKYTDVEMELTQVKNCIIELLNSELIDVDKLDYIIRDAFTSGYQNVSIDYNRLLGGMVIVYDQNEVVLAYHKRAQSVIENVIYAHDCERKWIQNHPVILYENFLLEHCIRKVNDCFEDEEKTHPLFSTASLMAEGNILKLRSGHESVSFNISLLSDIDILFFIKNIPLCQDSLTEEYFNRNLRRHPLWKSEGEYKFLIENIKSKNKDKINKAFSEIKKFFAQFTETKKIFLPVINDESLKFTDKVEDKLKICKALFEILKKFSTDQEIDFDFVLISAKEFQSNFSKEIEIDNIKVWYPYDELSTQMVGKPDLSLFAKKKNEDKSSFYYLYIKRNDKQKVEFSKIIQLLDDLAEKYTELSRPK